jgi:hypothetical protein
MTYEDSKHICVQLRVHVAIPPLDADAAGIDCSGVVLMWMREDNKLLDVGALP